MLIITIKQGKEKSLLAGDPWIYASAVEKIEGKPQEKNKPGATATVQTSSRQFIGRAAYNAKSQICARIWTYKEDEPVDHALIKRRVKAAIAKRAASVRAAGPNDLVPVVRGDLMLKGRVHQAEARHARAHTTRQLKITLPGPMTIADTVADSHYGDKMKMAMAFADLLNQEARALQADGVDVIQFDEPAFNVFMDEVPGWGIEALHRAIDGLTCTTAVHICYGYGIQANIDWKNALGQEWRQYEKIFPALAKSRVKQVSLECINSRVP